MSSPMPQKPIKKKKAVKADPARKIRLSSSWYENGFNKMALATVFLSITTIALLVSTVYLAVRDPGTKYLSVTADNRIIELQMLNEPPKNSMSVLSFASESVFDIFDMSHNKLSKDISRIALRFTDAGWARWEQGVKPVVQAIVKGKLFVQATPTGAPIIIKESNSSGIYEYALRIPAVVTYTSVKGDTVQRVIIEMSIVRADRAEFPLGLAIKRATSIPQN